MLLVAVNCCTLAQRVVRYVGEAFAFRDSVLDEVALWNGEEAFERMRMKYRFKKVDAGRLKHLYMEREKEKVFYVKVTDVNKIFPLDKFKRIPTTIEYAGDARILDELDFADKIIRRIGCRTIDVTQRAIEDTALIIIKTLTKEKKI